MPGSKAPWWPFYADDFFTDERVAAMDWAQIGVYIYFLSQSWKHGGISSDPSVLAKQAKMSRAKFAKLWPEIRECWIEVPGDPMRLVQPRQELERGKKDSLAERNRKNGGKGGRPRKG